jgi:hypothetical protein
MATGSKTQRPDLCQDSSTIDRAGIHRQVAADALTFFNRVFER